MRSEECPKCGEVIEGKWHQGYVDGTKDKRHCHKNDMIKYNKEHMHFNCRCGYDFIGPVEQEGVQEL